MITVITPTYNGGKYISKCIEGVCMQKGVCPMVHIIVDNMSNDGTGEIVNNYKKNAKHEVIYIREKDNNHLEAMRKGLNITNTNLVTVCNSSDFFYYDYFFNKASSIMLNNIDISCVFGLIKCISNFNDLNNKKEVINRASTMLNINDVAFRDFKLFITDKISWNETGTIFRTEVLKDIMIKKMSNIHPWLEIVRNFYMTSYIPYFIPNIVTCCLNHDDSVGKKNGIEESRQEEIRCFTEHYNIIDTFVNKNNTTLYNYKKKKIDTLNWGYNGKI